MEFFKITIPHTRPMFAIGLASVLFKSKSRTLLNKERQCGATAEVLRVADYDVLIGNYAIELKKYVNNITYIF